MFVCAFIVKNLNSGITIYHLDLDSKQDDCVCGRCKTLILALDNFIRIGIQNMVIMSL